MGIIYKYTSPSGKSYIGQTINTMAQRAGGKEGQNYKGCVAFYDAIKKYGFENFTKEILEECDNEILDEREQYWIKHYKTQVPYGYNLTAGGQKNEKTWSKQVYQFSQKGELVKIYPSVTQAAIENKCAIASISEACGGRKKTLLGYVWSFTNTPPSPHTKYRLHKHIYQFDEEGYLVKEFEEAINAARFYHIEYTQILQCAGKQRRKRVNGNMIFTYEPFVDWNYYTLKHKRSSTTIPSGSTLKREEALRPEISGEDIVSTYEKS